MQRVSIQLEQKEVTWVFWQKGILDRQVDSKSVGSFRGVGEAFTQVWDNYPLLSVEKDG